MSNFIHDHMGFLTFESMLKRLVFSTYFKLINLDASQSIPIDPTIALNSFQEWRMVSAATSLRMVQCQLCQLFTRERYHR